MEVVTNAADIDMEHFLDVLTEEDEVNLKKFFLI